MPHIRSVSEYAPEWPTEAEDSPGRDQLRARLFEDGSTFRPTSRDQIVGIDNILGEIEEIIHWLRHAAEYQEYTSRLQPGVVFAGSPGTGKTLVSRWIATESDALFINVRDFVHSEALFSDRDIQQLFALARAAYERTHRPVVLFWDEFENSAMERGSNHTSAEQKSVVSALTAELDGVHGKNEGILLIGCTNYLDCIDHALLRRGRMGVQIEFHAPDRAGKERILAHYLGQMATAADIDIHTLSYFFPKDNTAADIEEACVEAWRNAVRRSIDGAVEPRLNQEDLVRVFTKQLVGPPTTFVLPDEEKLPIAIHECGHAICAISLGIPLRLITVQPGKKALGRVMVDDVNQYIGTIEETVRNLMVGLGGLAAERVAAISPSTGASADIARVTTAASLLVNTHGAGEELGLMSITALNRMVDGYSEMSPQVSTKTIEAADRDVRNWIDYIETGADHAIERVGADKLIEIASRVIQHVTMTGTDFRDLYIEVCGFEPEVEA